MWEKESTRLFFLGGFLFFICFVEWNFLDLGRFFCFGSIRLSFMSWGGYLG